MKYVCFDDYTSRLSQVSSVQLAQIGTYLKALCSSPCSHSPRIHGLSPMTRKIVVTLRLRDNKSTVSAKNARDSAMPMNSWEVDFTSRYDVRRHRAFQC